MRAAGLTHGGFYNHFDSKEALEAEAARIFSRSSSAGSRRSPASKTRPTARAPSPPIAGATCRPPRATPRAPACPMVAFAGDISRRPARVRAAYAEGLAAYLDAFARASGRRCRRARRAEAISEFATLVGALALARSVARENPSLSDAILRAAAL